VGQRGALLSSVLVALVVIAVALAVRRPAQRRIFAGTGWEEWRQSARSLPWRDRWTLSRANSRGRAAPERLAALAVRRGEVVTAALARSSDRRSRYRWVLRVAMALAFLGLAVKVAGFALGDRDPWWTWLSPIYLVAFWTAYRPLLRRRARLVARSVERNRALLDP
jgi:hypothetical protein